MNSLQITDTKAKRMDEVEDLALETVKKALMGNLPADEEVAKLAIKSLSVIAKNRQTTNHKEAMSFVMATTIGTDEQVKRYVAATNPEVKKALTGK